MNSPRVTFVAELERKHPKLPVYFVVPNAKAQALRLCATEIVEGTVNGSLMGRRSIKQWDAQEGSHCPPRLSCWPRHVTKRLLSQLVITNPFLHSGASA